MLKKFRVLITKPKLVFVYMQAPFKKVIQYMLLMVLFLLLPTILLGTVNPSLLFIDGYEFEQMILKDHMPIYIEEGKLDYQDYSHIYQVDTYYFVFKENYNELFMGYVFHFNEESLDFYVSSVRIDRISYLDLGIESFSFTNESDLLRLGGYINRYVTENPIFRLTFYVSIYTAHLIQFLIIALIFAFFSKNFIPIPMPYKIRFMVSVNLMSIYTLMTLIGILLNIELFAYLGILLAFIYHITAYKSIKIVERKL